MNEQAKPHLTKDDSNIRRLTQAAEQERRASGLSIPPANFQAATELWRSLREEAALARQEPETVLELKVKVDGHQLTFVKPTPLPVHNNEICLGKTKIILTLEGS